jgi:hypothetical protein
MATRTITFSILVLCLSGTKLSAQVTAGTRLQSPDHRFVVACRVGEQISPAVGLIEIIDAGTAKKLCSFEIDAPLYALKWTANSKTIIAVHHVSGGTIAQIIHLTSGKWSSLSGSASNR